MKDEIKIYLNKNVLKWNMLKLKRIKMKTDLNENMLK